MNLVAKQAYKKSRLIPLLSWGEKNSTSFGDYNLEFDFKHLKVYRSNSTSKDEIASICTPFKGGDLANFFGTIESDDFEITKNRQHMLSGNRVYEVITRGDQKRYSGLSLPLDMFNPFKIGSMVSLMLLSDGQSHIKVEGTYKEGYRNLAEIIASLLRSQHSPVDSV